MPWCQNDKCGKTNLKKDEVVFDEQNHRILCVPCGQEASVSNQALMGEVIDKTWFGIGYTTDQGLKAEFVYGGAKLAVNVTNDQFMRFLGQ
jgi:hypothetical protein